VDVTLHKIKGAKPHKRRRLTPVLLTQTWKTAPRVKGELEFGLPLQRLQRERENGSNEDLGPGKPLHLQKSLRINELKNAGAEKGGNDHIGFARVGRTAAGVKKL